MSNLSIWDRNVIHALQAYAEPEEAERIYLASIDRHGRVWAERAAIRWAEAAAKIKPMLTAAQNLHDGQDHGVLDFIRTRFIHWENAA